MTDYNGIYNKLTKKELLYTLIARDEMLKNCRDRFQAHKETDARTIPYQSDLIEELEEQIYLYKDTIDKQNHIYNMLLSDYKTLKDKLLEYGKGIVSDCCIKTNTDIYQENKQLKQQLHDLPKKIVCEISEAIERLSWRKRIYTNWEFDKEQLYKDLDTILKKYGEENE